MLDPKYLRARAAKCVAIAETVSDVIAKAALFEMAADLNRWADELDGVEETPKANGGV
jgi:hypothetical protein